MKDLRKSFATVLKELRAQSGMSQQELADYSSVERSYISRLEGGMQMPSIETVFKLADILKIKPSEFIHLVERKQKP